MKGKPSESIKKRTVKQPETRKHPFDATSASVKRLRKHFSMTPLEFSRLVGVSQTSVLNWEHQGGKLNLQRIRTHAGRKQIDLNTFVGGAKVDGWIT